MAIELFMDCGAPSIYNELSKKKGLPGVMSTHMRNWKYDDYSYVETPEYKAYRQSYADYLRANADILSIYPNLDVVHNAELTWENHKWMEAQGLKPWPVWHLGSDVKWLRKYLAKGHNKLCLGGLVPNPPQLLRPALDRVWGEELTDKHGMPLAKVHGFGMTSFDIMYRYPWYSVDSKSWVDYSRFGWILVPPMRLDGSFDWQKPARIGVSHHSIEKRPDATCYLKASPAVRKGVHDLLEVVGVPLGKSAFKDVPQGHKKQPNEVWMKKAKDGPGRVEVVLEQGVMNSYLSRMDVNLFVFKKIEESIPAWPWAFDKGKASRSRGLMAGGVS